MDAANGWNGAKVRDGQVVRVRDKSVCGARGVVEGRVSDCGDRFCTLTITRASRSTCWQPGNKITIGLWWLEPVA